MLLLVRLLGMRALRVLLLQAARVLRDVMGTVVLIAVGGMTVIVRAATGVFRIAVGRIATGHRRERQKLGSRLRVDHQGGSRLVRHGAATATGAMIEGMTGHGGTVIATISAVPRLFRLRRARSRQILIARLPRSARCASSLRARVRRRIRADEGMR